jgi:hypothetical protein
MPYKTFTPSVLTAADMNDYLMKQSVITCTSGTRPSSPVEGMTIFETDTDCYATYDGSGWVYMLGGVWRTWSPTLIGVSALGNGSVSARYTVIGKTVIGKWRFFAGSTTTYSGIGIGFSAPITAVSTSTTDTCGSGFLDAGSAGTRRLVVATHSSTANINLQWDGGGPVDNTSPVTLGTGGRISINFTYEAA